MNRNSHLIRNDQMTAVERIEAFLSERPNLTAGSRTAYFSILRRFYRWCQDNGVDYLEIRLRHMAEYSKTFDNYSDLSKHNNFSLLRHHFAWLENNGLGINVLRGDHLTKLPRRYKTFRKLPLSGEQVRRLLEQPNGTICGQRDQALISLLVFCGIRLIEAHRANYGDITPDGRGLYIQRKGSKQKDDLIRLPEHVQTALNDYLIMRPAINDNSPLFAAHSRMSKNRLHQSTASRIVKGYLKAIGLNSKYYTAHSLRHTAASLLLRAGASAVDLQKFLGHANFQTSQLYFFALEQERVYEQNLGQKIADSVFSVHQSGNLMNIDDKSKIKDLQALKKNTHTSTSKRQNDGKSRVS